MFRAGGIRRATLCHVAVASAARAQFLETLFHQRAHVIRQAGALRKDQRGLRAAASQQCYSLFEAYNLLRQQLDEGEIAIGEVF